MHNIWFITQIPMNDKKMEQSNEPCLGLKQVSYLIEKILLPQPKTYKASKPLRLVRTARMTALFPEASLSLPLAAAIATDSETQCAGARPWSPVQPAQAVLEHCPKSLAND